MPLLVDHGTIHEATPAGRIVVPDLHHGVDDRVIPGDGLIAAPIRIRARTPAPDPTRIEGNRV